VPTISRTRTLGAGQEEIWAVLADPERMSAWWPGVQRVEDVSPGAWTAVFRSPKGKVVRADYSLEASDGPDSVTWRHEVEESPFERILAESLVDIELEPVDEGETRVEMRARMKLRGFARLGGIQVRRATGRTLDGALEGLETLVGEQP
jgi:carbon monoxide dehydrogenase subunit G